jgi:hypothetical protein
MAASSTAATLNTMTTTTTAAPLGFVAVPAPQWALALAQSLSAVELCFHSVVAVVAALNTAVLWRTSVVHPNLRALLVAQSAAIIFYECGRLCIVSQKFLSGNIFNRCWFIINFFINK